MNPEKIVTAVTNGDLDEAIIDDKVRRLLRLIERVGDGYVHPPAPVAAAHRWPTAAPGRRRSYRSIEK
jgi:beta-glucosidase-like glycosyl hydrolase